MHSENNFVNDSNLRTLDTQGGFYVPKGYFKSMRNHILRETTELVASKNFQVPDDYFEQSRKAILSKTTGNPTALKIWYTQSRVKYIAAAIVLFLSSLTFILYNKQHQSGLQSMTDDEILLYFEQEGVRDIPVSEVSFTLGESTTNNEERYLMNHADEQSIIEEL